MSVGNEVEDGGWLSCSPHKIGITSLLDDVRKLDVSMAGREDGHTRSMVRVKSRRGHSYAHSNDYFMFSSPSTPIS